MKNLFKSTAIMAALVLASCATQEAIVPAVTSDDAISFGTFMDQATKSEIFDNDAMQTTGFGVMGYRTAQIGWNAAAETAIPDFMYNEHITYNDIVANGWGYNPVKYWSNIEGDKYTFFAYAPYSGSTMADGGIVMSANDAAGAPVVSFTVNDDPKAMVDFVAGQEINVQQQTDAVKFNLKHQLTRVTFSATTDIDADEAKGTSETFVVIKRMDLVAAEKFYESGDYTFDNEDTTGYEDYETPKETEADHAQDGVWSNLEAFASVYPFSTLLDANEESIGGFTESGVRVVNDNTVYTSLFIKDQYLFLLPPNGQNGIKSEGEMSFEIEYKIVTADEELAAGYTASDSKISTVSFPVASLKQGRAYNLILTIDLTEVKVQAVVIDWDEEYDVNAETGYGPNPVYDIAVEEIELSADPSIINAGETTQIEVATEPYNANEDLTWSSSDETIATVDQDGLVTGVAKGTVTITATAAGTYTRAEAAVSGAIEIEVQVPAQVSDLAILGNDTLYVGTDYEFGYEFSDEVNAPEGDAVWSSSDKAIATVDQNGVVTPVSEGTTTITLTIGSLSVSYQVTVADPTVLATGIVITGSNVRHYDRYGSDYYYIELDNKNNSSIDLTAILSPEDATGTITWSTSDTKGEYITLTPAADGATATVYYKKYYSGYVTVTASVVGEGGKTYSFSIRVYCKW